MSPAPGGKLLLIAWDSADWHVIHPLLDRGLLPNLASLVESGVSGNLQTVHPPIAPIVWNSLATGKTADKHGVLESTGSTPRRCKAIWNILSEAGRRTHVVGWPCAGPAEQINGTFVNPSFAGGIVATATDWPLQEHCVSPASLRETLEDLRVHPTSFNARTILPFVPQMDRVRQTHDDRLGRIAVDLAVTCSFHNAATWILENQEWDFLAVYSGAIARFSEAFMPFHPPALQFARAEDAEIYGQAVDGIYRFHDMLLGRLIHLAGPDASVMLVSNHGYHSGERRPPTFASSNRAVNWHRELGVFALRAPGVLPDEVVYNCGLLDVAPTVLALCGVPVPRDMDGAVLMQAFGKSWQPERIETWEAVSHPAPETGDGISARELAKQFTAFDSPEAEEEQFHLATVFITTGRPFDALPLLEQLTLQIPEEIRYMRALIQCCLAAGTLDRARGLLSALFSGEERYSWMYFFQGLLHLHEKNAAAALQCFNTADSFPDSPAYLPVYVGNACASNQRWNEAQENYLRALSRDPDCAEAYLGLSAVSRRRRQYTEAVQQALKAIELDYQLPMAHYHLGESLARLGEFSAAETALRQALRLAPSLRQANAALGRLLAQQTIRGAQDA